MKKLLALLTAAIILSLTACPPAKNPSGPGGCLPACEYMQNTLKCSKADMESPAHAPCTAWLCETSQDGWGCVLTATTCEAALACHAL